MQSNEFLNTASSSQGVGIMAFQITQGATVEQVYQNYKAKHPNLLVSEGAGSDSDNVVVVDVVATPPSAPGRGARGSTPPWFTIVFLCAIPLQRSRGSY